MVNGKRVDTRDVVFKLKRMGKERLFWLLVDRSVSFHATA